MNGKGFLVVGIILMCVGFGGVIHWVATGQGETSARVVSPPPSATTPTEEGVPEITEFDKTTAINQIKAYPEVLDAAVEQDDKELSLVLIVEHGTSEELARQLGDNFVRLVKTFGPEPAPGKVIGEGMFNYLIGVYYPNEELIAMGSKVSFATYITW